jgi:peptide deformylase
MSSSHILPIAQTGEPILKQQALPVSRFDLHLAQLAQDMLTTMLAAKGVGIAAPQVHSPLALFIMASAPNERYPDAPITEPTVIINPEILSHTNETEAGVEGCLSIPNKRISIRRYSSIEVRFQDLQGTFHHRKLSGFEARIFQHELDHLHGITLIEREQLNRQDFNVEQDLDVDLSVVLGSYQDINTVGGAK